MQSFRVNGIPQPGGSKRSFHHRQTNRLIVIDANPKAAEWKKEVANQVRSQSPSILTGAVRVVVKFELPRPKYHFNKGGLRNNAPAEHLVKPDATKLWRSTEDALTGILWDDDAQIVKQEISKCYGDCPGVDISVESIG